MKFEDMINALTPQQYHSLKLAVELGKWPDGRLLEGEQRELSLRVLIAYDLRYKQKQDRIGYIDMGKKKECEHDEHEAIPLKNLQ